MLNPLEEKILRYLIEHKNEGEFVSIKLPDERLADVCMATKSLARKGYVKDACTLLSASACLTPDGKYYFNMEEKRNSKAKKFYQVLIVTSKGEKVVETDITDIDELFNRILIPYVQEVEFFVNGFVLEKKKITRIKIGFTEKSAKEIAAYKNETMPRGVFMVVSKEDIVEYDCTKDITATLIAKAKDLIAESNKKNRESKKMDNTKVFLVHGKLNQVWVSDITMFRLKEKNFYICVILDLYSRAVVGYKIGIKNSTQLTKSTFKTAYINRQPQSGLMFHSDNGGNYCCKTFQTYLIKLNVEQSFSRPYVPYDNSVMESFFSSVKREELYRRKFKSENEFHKSVDEYIIFYNEKRPHYQNIYRTPLKKEQDYYASIEQQ